MAATGIFDLFLLGGFLAIPMLGVVAMLAVRRARDVLSVNFAASCASGALSLGLALRLSGMDVVVAAGGFFRADHFSAWHLLVLGLAVFAPSSLFAIRYFSEEPELSLKAMRRFGAKARKRMPRLWYART